MTPLYHSRPERWPQVSLKGFFVLVTFLGMLFSWYGAQKKWIRERHEAWETYVRDAKEWTGNYSGWRLIFKERGTSPAPWQLRPFGEFGVGKITVWMTGDAKIDRETISEVQRLFPEATMHRMWFDSFPLPQSPSHFSGEQAAWRRPQSASNTPPKEDTHQGETPWPRWLEQFAPPSTRQLTNPHYRDSP